jgi:hypothetical protein
MRPGAAFSLWWNGEGRGPPTPRRATEGDAPLRSVELRRAKLD